MQSLFERNLELLFSRRPPTSNNKHSDLKEKFLLYNEKIANLKINLEQCIHNKITSINYQDSDEEYDGYMQKDSNLTKSKKTIKKTNQASAIFLNNPSDENFCKNSKIYAIDSIDLTKILVNKSVTQNIQGGLVIQNAEFVTESVISVDFTSLYSSLIVKYNFDSSVFAFWSQFLVYIKDLDIYVSPFENKYVNQMPIPIKYGNYLIYSIGFFIRSDKCGSITSKYLIRKMKERNEIKSRLNQELPPNEREYLQFKEVYIKRLMNTIYGNLNCIFSNSYLPELAAAITMKARNQLFSLSMFIKFYCIKHKLISNLFTVYGDTDSVFIKFVLNKNIDDEYLHYLNTQYKDNREMQTDFQNWNHNCDKTEKYFKNEAIKRWNVEKLIENIDQDTSAIQLAAELKQIINSDSPTKWANIYDTLKREIRYSDSKLSVFIVNDIAKKYGLLDRNRISKSETHSDLVVALKIENHFKPFVILKKKNYTAIANNFVFSKGRDLITKTHCSPIREYLLNLSKLLLKTKKSLSQNKLEKIFKIYMSRPDELFLMREHFKKSLYDYKGCAAKIRQLRLVSTTKSIRKDVVLHYSYYKMFFESPYFGKILDYTNRDHCRFLARNGKSTLLFSDLKKLMIKGNLSNEFKCIHVNEMQVDKEFILKKFIKNLIESLNKLFKHSDVFTNFSEIFSRVWLLMFGSNFNFTTDTINNKQKNYSDDSFIQLQTKRMKYNFKAPKLV